MKIRAHKIYKTGLTLTGIALIFILLIGVSAAKAATLSGTVYTDESTTLIGNGAVIRLIINDASAGTYTTSGGTGTYSITPASLNSGDAILVYIDGHATDGTTVTVSDGNSLSGLDIYGGHLITRHDNSGSLTNAMMKNAKDTYVDTEILYSVDGSNNLTVSGTGTELYLPAGHNFTPAGDITGYHYEIRGTIKGDANTFTASGTWVATSGTVIADTMTLVFDGSVSNMEFFPGPSTYYNVDINKGNVFLYLRNNLTASNTLTFNAVSTGSFAVSTYTINTKNFTWGSGYLWGSNHTINVSGNLITTGVGYFSGSLNTNYAFVGSGNGIFNPGTLTHGNITINKDNAANVITLNSNALNLTGGSALNLINGIFDIAGKNLNIGAGSTFSNTGTLRLQGGEAISNLINDIDSGTVVYNGSASYSGLILGNTYYNAGFENAAGTWTLNAALDVNADLTMSSGTLDVSGTNHQINVAGNWSNSGTFNAQSGLVVLDGGDQGINGSTTFYSLTKTESSNDTTNVTLTFDNTAVQTFNGTVTLDGLDDNDRITLVSDSPGNHWDIVLGATSTKAIDYIDVSWSDASGSDATKKPINPTNSTDGGNTIEWFNSCPVVSTTADSGSGSLRECINYANSNPGTTISFNIPNTDSGFIDNTPVGPGGDDWWRITLAVCLPDIAATGTVIDGSTQTSNQGDKNSKGPEIEIDGNKGTVATCPGLNVNNVGNVTIRELVIGNFSSHGVMISGASANGVNLYGNYIGTDAVGGAQRSNDDMGIWITTNATNINIGGTNPGEGNILSGSGSSNTEAEISVGSSTNVNILGNIIGLDRTGTIKLGFTGPGISISGGDGITIGGNTAEARNFIAGNNSAGITITNWSRNITIKGNYIGTGITGTETTLGNGADNIYFTSFHDPSNIVVGGLGTDEGNLIGRSSIYGIRIQESGIGDQILGNFIFNNVSGGIYSRTDSMVIVKNQVYNNGGGQSAIQLVNDTGTAQNNNHVYHNTIHGNGGGGIIVTGLGAIIKNNIITGNNGYGIFVSGGTMTEAYNLVTDNTIATVALRNTSGQSNVALDGTTINTDPDFTNEPANLLTLQNTSPAINRGCDLDNAGCRDAGDGAQPDLTAGANPNFYGFGPDQGAFENTLATTCPVSTTADASPTAPYASLRDCINYANANAGTTVQFSIGVTDAGYQTAGGDNWWRISPVAGYAVAGGGSTTIDAATQTSIIGDLNSPGPEIEIDGGGAAAFDAITIMSSSNTVRGFIIGGFPGSPRVAVKIAGGNSNYIEGNYLGTDYKGTAANTNFYGIYINGGAQSNTIGGTTALKRNVISGNSYGVYFTSANTNSNFVEGNFIGTTANGASALANAYGVMMANGPQTNTVGGTSINKRNIISGNSTAAISIYGTNTNANIVKGNFMGTDVSGTNAVANGYGVVLSLDAQSNIIGGTGADEGNTIAFNTIDGVGLVDAGTDDNTISGNSIFSNAGLGIDIFPNGVGTGSGANNDKPAPTISSVTPSGSDFIVVTTVTSGDTVEFFRVNNAVAPVVTADGTGSGEGFLYLGSCTDDGLACSGPHISGTDPTAADGSVTVTLTSSGLSSVDILTATATDGTNGTSEFSANAIIITISGTVFTDEGSTNIGAGKTVRLLVNGSSFGTDTTDASGNYSIAASINADDAIVVYVDDGVDGTDDGTTVTISDGNALANLDIYVNHLITRHDNSGSINNALMKTAVEPYSDTEILYSVDGSIILTVSGSATELYVPTGHTFVPGANVNTVHMKIIGTVTAGGNTYTVSGDWDSSGGTVVYGSSTLKMTGVGKTFQTKAAERPWNLIIGDGVNPASVTHSVPNWQKVVSNDLVLSDTATLNVSGFYYYMPKTGSITLGTGATLDISGVMTRYIDDSSSHISTAGTISGTGTFEYAILAGSTNAPVTARTYGVDLSISGAVNAVGVLGGGVSLDLGTKHLRLYDVNTNNDFYGILDNPGNIPVTAAELYVANPLGSGNAPWFTGKLICRGATYTFTNVTVYSSNTAAPTIDCATGGESSTWNVSGNVTIDASRTYNGLISAGSSFWTVGGNWSNSGTFTAGSSTVVFDGDDQAINGSTTFNNFTKAESANNSTDVTLTFDNTATLTINGTLTLDGLDDDDRINLVSDSPGSYWELVLGATAAKVIDYVDVRDSDASGSDVSRKPVNPADSLNSGNNVDWFYGLTIVKQVWEIGGTSPLGNPTAPVGSTLVFLIYVKNINGSAVSDLRINDDLDETGFEYVAGSLRRTSDTVPPADTDFDLVIFNKSGDGTSISLSDAVDTSPATEVSSAQDMAGPVGVDKITVGAVAGQANESLSIGANETFALRFKVKVK